MLGKEVRQFLILTMTFTIPLRKVKGPTPIALDYVWTVLPPLVEKASVFYNQRPTNRTQPILGENAYASAAIILTAISIESYANTIFYYENVQPGNDIPKELSEILHTNQPSLPQDYLKALLDEVYVLRNVIAHGHLYETEFRLGQNIKAPARTMSLEPRLGKANPRWKNSVNIVTRRTRKLGLNIRPVLISFEDLLKILIMFDLTLAVSANAFRGMYTLPPFSLQVSDFAPENLSSLLACCYCQIRSQDLINRIDSLAEKLRKRFAQFTPPNGREYCFITNQCPNCLTLGFRKQNKPCTCVKCGKTC